MSQSARQGGPDATINTGPDPYPSATPANNAPITGWGWELMMRRYKRMGWV